MGKSKKYKDLNKKKFIDKDKIEDYNYHLPVLLKESVDYLVWRPDGTYIDGTLGGGGHTEEILRRLVNGKLIAFDKDEEAIAHCRDKFWGDQVAADTALMLVNDSFSRACSITESGGISGLLLDLGLSSHQLDEGLRGFSHRQNAPIDMRFGSTGKSAEDLLNACSEEELMRILYLYGEEPFAKGIARRISIIRRATPIRTTLDLRSAVEMAVSPKFLNKSLARVFQAVRIAVNGELDVLEETLRNFPKNLETGGRIVVISYHSLEDRIVKTIFREKSKSFNQRTAYQSNLSLPIIMPELKIITPKPLIPSEEETEKNPRARSAKMRVAERV